MPAQTPTANTVIRAVHDLHGRADAWPTVEEIAKYLKLPESVVLTHLRALRRSRIFDSRRRQGKTRWMPWREAH